MKRYILSIAVLLLSVSGHAEFVSKTQAEAVAKDLLSASSVEYVWNGMGDKKYGDENPAFFVFNGGGGWAVISADDCTVPVLMHGDGQFCPDDIPDNMRSLLRSVEQTIFEARNNGLTQSSSVRKAWSGSGRIKAADAEPQQVLFETASWNQGNPYNVYCPKDGDELSVTGCVATAMAIVMQYFKWPENASGKIPAYVTATKSISVAEKDIDGFEYDWDNMLLKYSSRDGWTEPQKEAVARLMEHCGAMVKMDYAADGSGAYSRDVIPAMVNYMSYSSMAKELYRYNFTSSEWFDMIKAELDAGHPLIYGGQDANGHGGHQFVCDGYNVKNEVHINWGWGGAYNAWYAVCYLGPASPNEYVFNLNDSAMFGLVPAGSEYEQPILEISSGAGLAVTDGTIASGNFSLSLTGLKSRSAYSGSLKAALITRDGTVKEYISEAKSVNLQAGVSYSYDFGCTVSTGVKAGDYVGVMYSCSDDEWRPVHILSKAEPARLAALDITMIDIPSEVPAGYRFYFGLLSGAKGIQSVSWYLDGTKTTSESIIMTSGSHTLKAAVRYADGSTETIVRKVSVQ